MQKTPSIGSEVLILQYMPVKLLKLDFFMKFNCQYLYKAITSVVSVQNL